MEGRTYRYMKKDALYPFGYGLSYTFYEVSGLKLSSETVTDDGIDVEVMVKNTGAMAGRETVQAYVKINPEAPLKHVPNFSLKGIKKLNLDPGEEKKAVIHLPKEAFALADENGEFVINKGTATVFVDDSAPDNRSIALTGKAPLSATVTL